MPARKQMDLIEGEKVCKRKVKVDQRSSIRLDNCLRHALTHFAAVRISVFPRP